MSALVELGEDEHVCRDLILKQATLEWESAIYSIMLQTLPQVRRGMRVLWWCLCLPMPLGPSPITLPLLPPPPGPCGPGTEFPPSPPPFPPIRGE